MNELTSAPATWTASMESPVSEHGNLWAIVLAGGEGMRLRGLTRRLYGDDRPKQYAALVGARSLLRQTLDRVGLLVPPERTVVVTLASHARYVETNRHMNATIQTSVLPPRCCVVKSGANSGLKSRISESGPVIRATQSLPMALR